VTTVLDGRKVVSLTHRPFKEEKQTKNKGGRDATLGEMQHADSFEDHEEIYELSTVEIVTVLH